MCASNAMTGSYEEATEANATLTGSSAYFDAASLVLSSSITMVACVAHSLCNSVGNLAFQYSHISLFVAGMGLPVQLGHRGYTQVTIGVSF